jgi:copper homeostasis protein
VRRAAGRIAVMPGGSVRTHNVARILAETGARDVHFRAAAPRANHISPHRPDVRMSSSKPPSDAAREETSIDAVREMVMLVSALDPSEPAR